jgi:NAD(P)-dependent dehydrogenase (short-subunit alcohol dehydrogenase family)
LVQFAQFIDRYKHFIDFEPFLSDTVIYNKFETGGCAMQKISIVTGGANGIGRCITEELIKDNYFVFVIDTDCISGEKLAEKYDKTCFQFFCGDIAEHQVLDSFIKEVIKKHTSIDVLVNNACVNRGGLFDCSYDDFNYVLRLGVTAAFYLTQQLLPHFSQGASIINISSTRSTMSQKNTESYTAAKGAISALTHAMSISLAGRVRVNSISPGWIDTGAYQHEDAYIPDFSKEDMAQHPSGRVGVPNDIAQMVLFLCSDKAGFITGENITIDGGMTKQMIYHGDHGWTYKPGEI